MNKLFLIIFSIILFACSEIDQVELFNAEMSIRWFSAFKFEVINQSYVNSNETIIAPVNTWQHLLTVTYLDKDLKTVLKEDLWYKIPFKDRSGELVVSRHGKDWNDRLFQIAEITHLRMFTKKKTLTLDYKYQGIDKHNEIILLNENNNGIRYWPLQNKALLTSTTPYLGTISDRFELNSAISCHLINDSCQDISPNTCEMCKYGWYEVAGSKCEVARNKYCGIERCGDKNQPACIRGRFYHLMKFENGCTPDSSEVFCNEGLSIVCNGKGELVCQ